MPLFILLLLAFTAYGQQQKRVAIVNTEDDGEPPIKNSELTHLTDKLRELANKILPSDKYAVMTQQSIVAFFGSQENMIKECKESEGCLAKLGRKINADYIGQARIGRFGKDLTIKVELYESGSGNLINSFTAESKNIYGLLDVLNKKAPDLFKKLPGLSGGSKTASPAAVEKIITHYELDDNKSFTDARDGKKYKTVVIGKQTWMAENLNYNANSSKCYDNKPANCDKYGRLYNWETAMKACPKGWHLPSKVEWDVLTATVGGEITEGKYLKATSGWNENGNGEDKFGFAALPGGYGNSFGSFLSIGIGGNWWSASYAYDRNMNCISESAYWDNSNMDDFLLSVRCVKD